MMTVSSKTGTSVKIIHAMILKFLPEAIIVDHEGTTKTLFLKLSGRELTKIEGTGYGLSEIFTWLSFWRWRVATVIRERIMSS